MRELFSLMVCALAGSFALAEEKNERPLLYPFEVTLGGQKAEMGEWGDLFAVVKEPVKADAVLNISCQTI